MQSDQATDPFSVTDALLTLASPPFLFCLGISVLVLFHFRKNPSIYRTARAFLNQTIWKLEDSAALAMIIVALLFLTKTIISVLLLNGLIEENQLVPISIILQTLLFHIPIVLIILIMIYKRGQSFSSALNIRPKAILEDAGKGIVAYLASMPVIILANVISWIALHSAGVPQEPQFAIQVLIDPNPLWLKMYLIVMAVISAPLAEELLFRGVCFPALAKRTSPVRAAILISLLFATIHMNAYALLPLFVMALALSAAYACTKSIIVPLTMHAIFNAVNISIYILYVILKKYM